MTLFLFAMVAQAMTPPVVSPEPPIVRPNTAIPPPSRDDGDALNDLGRNDPPLQLIDFLGRRQLCWDGARSDERSLLRCASIPAEELGWRAMFAGDESAIHWLDETPDQFRMGQRFYSTFDGPSPTRARTVEQSGVDDRGRAYRLVIDRMANGGRSTRITASYAGWPARSFTLSNRAFPLIDLQSLEVGTSAFRELAYINVRLRYSYERSYCGDSFDDRRPTVDVTFERGRVSAQDTQRVNCDLVYLNVADAAAPARHQRRSAARPARR
jgi:hypothetical protein